jgi:hypothetical protein
MRIGQIVEVQSVNKVKVSALDGVKVKFGEFLKIPTHEGTSVGVVYNISRINPDLRLVVRPKEMTKEEILEAFPDSVERYPTIIDVFLVGYFNEEGKSVQDIPPTPPEIYDDVYKMKNQEIENFHREGDRLSLDYLSTISESELPNNESLIRRLLFDLSERFKIPLEECMPLFMGGIG